MGKWLLHIKRKASGIFCKKKLTSYQKKGTSMWLVFQHASNKLDMKGIRRKTRGCYGTTDIPKKTQWAYV